MPDSERVPVTATAVFIDPGDVAVNNWTLTVFWGSVLWPVLTFFTGRMDLGLMVMTMFLSWAGAVLTGLPALILLILLTKRLNKTHLPLKAYRRSHFLLHGIVSLATFGVLVPSLDPMDVAATFNLIGIALVYVIAAMFFWWRTFRKIGRTKDGMTGEVS